MVSPKIILNEEYLDLRKRPETITSRSNTGTHSSQQKDNSLANIPNLKSDGLRLEKELINCGLKKLVTSYNATTGHTNPQKQVGNRNKNFHRGKSRNDPRFRRFLVPEVKTACLKSTSEISSGRKIVDNVTSAPIFPSEKTSNIEVESPKKKYEYRRNKFTMTKKANSKERGLSLKNLSLGNHIIAGNYANQQSVDPRLCEKYSILKMPWKRTWTIPLFSHKSSMFGSFRNMDTTDRQTYLYDEGTEADSIYVEEKQKQFFSYVFQSQFMGLLFLAGSICGILLVSLLIWSIFGSDFFRIFFKPRETHEVSLKRYLKFIGGGIVYFVTNCFRVMGRVLTMPTQQVYQAPPEHYQWPVMQRPAD